MISLLPPFLTALFLVLLVGINGNPFEIKEASIDDIQQAIKNGALTSKKLVEYYLNQIQTHNPILRAVIEVNPDVIQLASQADQERQSKRHLGGGLHGIPILLKDTIATKDRLNTTTGSLALLGSVVPRDAEVVQRLRQTGAIILGKTSLSEWDNFRSPNAPNGWSARGGQGKNPYVLSKTPCGSSTGSAVAVAANMVAVTLGTETNWNLLCPAALNSVVGIKPTTGLTSRAGVILISPRQDTIGPICRSVSDAVYVLDVIVGHDPKDEDATRAASKYIPQGGYKQFLKVDGLTGKKVGILRAGFFDFPQPFHEGSVRPKVYESHFDIMRKKGATLFDNLTITEWRSMSNPQENGEQDVLPAEFKLSLNAYLSELSNSPVKSLADIIDFNNKHTNEEKTKELGQDLLLKAQKTSGVGPIEKRAIYKMGQLSKAGLEKVMTEKQLDAVVTPNAQIASILALGGHPGITVPAGYDPDGTPFGICFAGLKGSEPKLIEIAYAFEQATKVRKPPSYKR